MNTKTIKEIVGLIADTMQDAELVTMSLVNGEEGKALHLTNASGPIVEAITGNGYSVAMQYGALTITADEQA